MRRFELRCYLDNGRIVAVEVGLDLNRHLVTATGSALSELQKHRLYDAYLALEHAIAPTSPELPPELPPGLRDIV